MKAVQFARCGRPWEVAEVVDLADPGPPEPGEIVIDILASPINPSDLLNFEGRFGAYAPTLPAIAGGEAVGRVSALGEGVTHLRLGDRVLALFAGRGNWRERRRLSAHGLFALPAEADTRQLAMFSVNPGTAWHMLTRFVSLKAGDWVLQNAGTSAVGHHVIRLARRLGVRTVSIVRRVEHVEPLRALGADAVAVDGPGLAERIAELVGAAPIPLALDAVAGASTQVLARAVGEGGVVVVYGVLSGNAAHFDAADVLFRNVAIRGFWFSAWFRSASASERQGLYQELFPLLADGTLTVPIEASYPLDQVRPALEHSARSGRAGKIVLTMNE